MRIADLDGLASITSSVKDVPRHVPWRNDVTEKNDPALCRHRYRLFNDIPGEWKLIWECVKCGKLCICKCFMKAMESMDAASSVLEFPRDHDIEALMKSTGREREEIEALVEHIPYSGMACELCLDLPSTHLYSEDLDGMDEFERRYGAYIMRTAVEMAAKEGEVRGAEDLWNAADDSIRRMYGFRGRGETDVDNDELFRIVQALFPNEEVLRNHYPEWLSSGPLEVYVPGIGIALEHRGPEHYEKWANASDEDRLRDVKERDLIKEEECAENRVTLIAFPYHRPVDRDEVGWTVAAVRSGKR